MREITYREAIREALRYQLQHDERVFLMGEDVGRGFVHAFAGMELFLAALVLIMFADRMLTWLLPAKHAQ